MTLLLVIATFGWLSTPCWAQNDSIQPDHHDQRISVRLPDGRFAQYALPADSDDLVYEFVRYETSEGRRLTMLERLTPKTGWEWLLLLVGLGGQMLFTGRVLLQWIASERAKRSIVPVGYWWFSIGGAAVLFTYFLLRHEPIGMLGQASGSLVYGRNLVLIARTHQRGHSVVEDLPPGDPAGQPIPDPNAEP